MQLSTMQQTSVAAIAACSATSSASFNLRSNFSFSFCTFSTFCSAALNRSVSAVTSSSCTFFNSVLLILSPLNRESGNLSKLDPELEARDNFRWNSMSLMESSPERTLSRFCHMHEDVREWLLWPRGVHVSWSGTYMYMYIYMYMHVRVHACVVNQWTDWTSKTCIYHTVDTTRHYHTCTCTMYIYVHEKNPKCYLFLAPTVLASSPGSSSFHTIIMCMIFDLPKRKAGQRSYTKLLCGSRESLETRLVYTCTCTHPYMHVHVCTCC